MVRFVIALCICVFSACSPPAPRKDLQEVRINLGTELTTLDPRKSRELQGVTVLRMLFDGLMRLDSEDRPEGAIAERVDIAEDKQTYTFHLRASFWTNGDPVTAEDFSCAWKKALDPAYPSSQAFLLYAIKNARLVKQGKLSTQELGINVLDEHTLEVILEEPTAHFLQLTTLPIFFPVNHKVSRVNERWADQVSTYVSNGPFLLKEWRDHDCITVAKNPEYWDAEAVQLDQIHLVMVNDASTELQMFEKKELDWAGSPLSVLPFDALKELQGNQQLREKPLLGTCFIRLNLNKAPFDRVDIRRAFGLALDRQGMIDHAIPATGLIPCSFAIQNKPYFQEGIREILGHRCPKVTLTYPSSENGHLLAQAIQQQWRENLGVVVTLEALEQKVYYARLAKQDFELILSSWIADFGDPMNFLEVFKYREGPNQTSWENVHYIGLLEQAKSALTSRERYQALQASEDLLMQEMPIIPLFHYTMLYLQDERLEDVRISSLGSLDFKHARKK